LANAGLSPDHVKAISAVNPSKHSRFMARPFFECPNRLFGGVFPLVRRSFSTDGHFATRIQPIAKLAFLFVTARSTVPDWSSVIL
jgi:hypothetical protein